MLQYPLNTLPAAGNTMIQDLCQIEKLEYIHTVIPKREKPGHLLVV